MIGLRGCVSITFVIASLIVASATLASAQTADYDATAKAQGTANSKPGIRHAPARDIPVPTDDVSPLEQKIIAGPYLPIFNAHPRNAAEWKELVNRLAEMGAKTIPALAEKFHVTVTPTVIAGVKCYIVEPKDIPARNRNRLLVHVHGGGYVLGPGLSATREAILLAGFGGFKVISVDYRMP
ncbi:MAG: hypothetical protein ACREFC_08055, partial [Stellaceae bacterium]